MSLELRPRVKVVGFGGVGSCSSVSDAFPGLVVPDLRSRGSGTETDIA